MFDTFYRTDPSRNNPAQGHGLGLAIVRDIIAGHGGRAWAENLSGLTVFIELPILLQEVPSEDTDR